MTASYMGSGSVRYSSIRANLGDSVLLQQPHGKVNLHGIDGYLKWELDGRIRTDTQPVFLDSTHVLVAGSDSNKLWKISLDRQATAELIATFPEFASLSVEHAEGDLTEDGYLALCGIDIEGKEWVFTYNIYTRQQGKLHHMYRPFDAVKATKDGYLLVSDKDADDQGVKVYPPLGIPFTIVPKNGHACAAVYEGKPVFLWCSNKRAVNWRNAVEMYDVVTGDFIRVLADFGTKNYAMHISAGPDAAYVSVFDPTELLPNQLWKTPFDGSIPTLLHEWRARYRDYESTPRATYSDGLILFNVDGGSSIGTWVVKDDVIITQPAPTPIVTSSIPDGYFEVSMENEPNSRYLLELPVKDGKALPWRMFKRNE